MDRWIGIALAIAALAGGAAVQADDMVNEQQYGNCYVVTRIDALTDEETHHLVCAETVAEMLTGTAIALSALKGGMGVVIFTVDDPMFHLQSHIDVAWRIDKGDVRTGNWLWSEAGGGGAVARDRSVFQSLLDELPAGKRIVIKVGSQKGIIPLDGSAAAIKDFRSRSDQSE